MSHTKLLFLKPSTMTLESSDFRQSIPHKRYLQAQISPFQANLPLLHTLKTSENLWFSDIFREYRNGPMA